MTMAYYSEKSSLMFVVCRMFLLLFCADIFNSYSRVVSEKDASFDDD